MKFEVENLIVAPCTPMYDDGSVNTDEIARYGNYLRSFQKVENIFILGTTGEGQNLTVQERKLVAEEWLRTGRSLFKRIIIHVGAGNLHETVDLANHAVHIKADAIAVSPPTYFKPETVEILGDYIAHVAKSVPEMPVMYYHLPAMTGANFAMMDLLDYMFQKVPNFTGMKFVSFNFPDFGLCMRKYGDRLTMAFGKDETLLFAAMMGGKAFVGASFNYIGKLFKEMFDLYKANDISAALVKQGDIQEIISKVGSKGDLKALTERISGIRLGPPRLPIRKGTDPEIIENAISATGLANLR